MIADPAQPALPALPVQPARPPEEAVLRAKAEEMEAAFLAEMLSFAGLGTTPQAFGGGVGETQFASFLRQAQAEEMVAAGGIGLAESIFRALTQGRDDPA